MKSSIRCTLGGVLVVVSLEPVSPRWDAQSLADQLVVAMNHLDPKFRCELLVEYAYPPGGKSSSPAAEPATVVPREDEHPGQRREPGGEGDARSHEPAR